MRSNIISISSQFVRQTYRERINAPGKSADDDALNNSKSISVAPSYSGGAPMSRDNSIFVLNATDLILLVQNLHIPKLPQNIP
jgi:hypothetical protein